MSVNRQDSVSLAYLLLSGTALGLLALMFWRCGAGLDFTDEGMYLNSINGPWLSRFSFTLFGFVYHPLYRLLGSDIVLLRQVNMLATFTAATALAFVVLRNAKLSGEPSEPTGLEYIPLAIVFATPSLAFYRVWIATPSYNSLNLQGMLIALTGVAWFMGPPGRRSTKAIGLLGPAALTGLGGWLVFMAKPTSAILLGATAAGVVLVKGRAAFAFIAFASATALALLVLAAVLIDGGVASFVRRITEGMLAVKQLSADYDIWSAFRWDYPRLNANEVNAFWALSIAAFTLTALAIGVPKACAAAVLSVTAVATAASAYWLLNPLSLAEMTWIRPASGVLLAGAPAGVAIVIVAAAWMARKIPRPAQVVLTLALLMSPYTYAYGTKSNIFHILPAAFVLVVVATAYSLHITLDAARARSASAVLGAAGLAVTTLVVGAAMERPYRLSAPLRLQESLLVVGPGQSRIRVDAATARYIEDFRRGIGAGVGSVPPVIDLTGRSPGALFAAGALPIGLPWMIGGLPGSEVLAARSLREVDCQTLSASWILSEEAGKRPLPPSVLQGTARQIRPMIRLESPNDGAIQLLTPPESDLGTAEARCQGLRR